MRENDVLQRRINCILKIITKVLFIIERIFVYLDGLRSLKSCVKTKL